MPKVSHVFVLATVGAKVIPALGRRPADATGGAIPIIILDMDGRRPMTPLLRQAQLQALMLGMALVFASATLACEKHLKGHQNSSETQTEGMGR